MNGELMYLPVHSLSPASTLQERFALQLLLIHEMLMPIAVYHYLKDPIQK